MSEVPSGHHPEGLVIPGTRQLGLLDVDIVAPYTKVPWKPNPEQIKPMAHAVTRIALLPLEVLEFNEALHELFNNREPESRDPKQRFPKGHVEPQPEVFPEIDLARYRAMVNLGYETRLSPEHPRFQGLARGMHRPTGSEYFPAEQFVHRGKDSRRSVQHYFPAAWHLDSFGAYPPLDSADEIFTLSLAERRVSGEAERAVELFRMTIKAIINANWHIKKNVQRYQRTESYYRFHPTRTRYFTHEVFGSTTPTTRVPGGPLRYKPSRKKV